MNWFSENKFLTGFGAVMLLGIGTLGYFTFSAMGKYETATGEFETALNNLKGLQSAKPALNNANLTDLKGQQQELNGKIAAFQKELKGRVLKEEPATMVEFQNQLKKAVENFKIQAAAAKIEHPKEFYMGFGEYQAKPPEAKAAPALSRQLKAIEMVTNVLIEARDLELLELQRDLLPEETGKAKPAITPPPSGKKPAPDAAPARKLVERNGLKVKFTSSDTVLQKVMAGLANHKGQLFIIRKLSVQNEKPDSPPRVGGGPPTSSGPSDSASPAGGDPSNPSPTPPSPEPSPGGGSPASTQATSGGSYTYVFGKERVTTILDLEILNIADP